MLGGKINWLVYDPNQMSHIDSLDDLGLNIKIGKGNEGSYVEFGGAFTKEKFNANVSKYGTIHGRLERLKPNTVKVSTTDRKDLYHYLKTCISGEKDVSEFKIYQQPEKAVAEAHPSMDQAVPDVHPKAASKEPYPKPTANEKPDILIEKPHQKPVEVAPKIAEPPSGAQQVPSKPTVDVKKPEATGPQTILKDGVLTVRLPQSQINAIREKMNASLLLAEGTEYDKVVFIVNAQQPGTPPATEKPVSKP